jgi:hypothetical protein
VTQNRRKVIESDLADAVTATIHPSAILRGDPERRNAEFAAFVDDLRFVQVSLVSGSFFLGLRALGFACALRKIVAQIFGIVVRLVPARVRLWRLRPEPSAGGIRETRREPESQQKSLHVQPPVVVVRRT